MNQFHWRSRASSHPTIAPPSHGGHQRIEIEPLFREPVLEARRALFVGDTAEYSVADQFTQSIR